MNKSHFLDLSQRYHRVADQFKFLITLITVHDMLINKVKYYKLYLVYML